MLSRRQSLAALGPDFECVGNAPRSGGVQVRVLTLNDGEHLDSTLFCLRKGWRLQFRPGPSLFGKSLSLFCNLPANAADEFDRARYRTLTWKHDASARGADDSAAFADLEIHRAGSFHFYFTFAGSSDPGSRGSGYFTVEPVLGFGLPSNELLPLDCVQCQTVLVKSLGPLDTWLDKLQVTRHSGYNMVHFTPIQELGGSNSSYSLRDQLTLNPGLSSTNVPVSIEDVLAVVDKLRTEWKVLSVCDIVLNHTANETPWLVAHPEATYNCANCPHLRPAYLLDAALAAFSRQVAKGDWTHRGVPPAVNSEDHLNAIRSALWECVLPSLSLSELFLADIEALVSEFLALARSRLPHADSAPEGAEVKLRQDGSYRRGKSDVDIELALHLYNVYRSDCFDEESRLRLCAAAFRSRVVEVNATRERELQSHFGAAVENTISGIRYFRVDPAGPRIPLVTETEPLVPRYFTSPLSPAATKDEEEAVAFCADRGRFLMAHNGWVMDSDPLTNFAAADSLVYLRRELIAWGDSVKLRYGERPEDSPFLWQHMTEYVEQTARVFDGIRLDNCHSTPIPVAEFLLDAARRVRPDLYVVAELFTNSDAKDNIFVNRLGITSLIREALSAWDGHELGRLVFRYGGEPVGAFRPPALRPLRPSVAHALFLDATHDNPSAVETRGERYTLPAAALVAMAACATGSSRGHDELVPHHIHVVEETRPYAAWGGGVDSTKGIIHAKRALNTLHAMLGSAGFTQVFVDQMDADVVAVTRHCPRDHQTVVLVAHTAFRRDQTERHVKPLRVQGRVTHVLLEASLEIRPAAKFVRSTDVINGLENVTSLVRENLELADSRFLELEDSGETGVTQLRFKSFPPGAVVAVKVLLEEDALSALSSLSALSADTGALSALANDLTLADANRVLYRCAEEERDDGGNVYDIPGFGAPVYCGLQGLMSLLSEIRPANDLGHPLCANLRAGDWIIDYMTERLRREPGTRPFGDWLASALAPVKRVPRFLVPSYFDVVVTAAYLQMLEAVWDKMPEFVSGGSSFTRWLALGSVQCTGVVRSAPLPALPSRYSDHDAVPSSLAAGLPHFAAGYMRTWGRDTFISLRGLFLLTGRFQDARNHILGFGGCLRHGLIPNLLDGGANARFNCRDAVWWWLHSVAAFVELAPDGYEILHDTVLRVFPNDSALPAGDAAKEQPLHEVIQEAMSVHFQGLGFRERNAGRAIDAHMTDQGFNNQIGIHPETGFVFGGNAANCGTWMDKMGSSDRAGNRGKPSSPRDGSAVELVGLSAAAARFLADMHEAGKFPHAGVTRTNRDGSKITWTYREWHRKIVANFETRFFVPDTPTPGEDRPELVHRRGIYKDTLGSQLPWTDFQLRPNFPVAIVVAPELFSPGRAWAALETAGRLLCGPLGMKTLDPGDWAYRGDYHNDNDSEDATVAHGFNYHQGPEWVWPIGFYLRARLRTALAQGGPALAARVVKETRAALAQHLVVVSTDPWRGLPELTNAEGKMCPGSCRTQAWSNATVLEVLYELSVLEGRAPIALDASE